MQTKFRKFALLMMIVALFAVVQVPVAGAAIADGSYTVNFSVLKDGTETVSTMDSYTIKPAQLEVDGTQYVYLTLKNSNWIQSFDVEVNGVYQSAEVVTPDTLVNGVYQRVVKFPITDVSEKVNAQTHVVVTGIPGFTYDNYYTVQLKFDSSTLTSL